jgi:hypothetical protein
MKNFFNNTKQSISNLSETVGNTISEKVILPFESGMNLFQELVGQLPMLVSKETSENSIQQYDEKHYFVIPYVLSEVGFSLHTMRCLPDGVPEINELEKRRIFHFPSEHHEVLLKHHMLETARIMSGENEVSSLEKLADNIDALDNKLTLGMLAVGGIAAIFNPLLGVGLAAKAVMPSVSGLLMKYTLRPAGEKLTQRQMESAAKAAEKQVLSQFSESNTLKLVNPILAELKLALETNEDQHNPLLDPNLGDGSIKELHGEHWRRLTRKAVFNVYKDVYKNPKLHESAQLGPEDIRWFEVIFSGIR